MPKRSSKKKPGDVNALAASIVEQATSEDEPTSTPEPDIEESADGKDPHAVALGRKGGKKGGPARAKKLTPERRREIARQAAQIRWQRHRETS